MHYHVSTLNIDALKDQKAFHASQILLLNFKMPNLICNKNTLLWLLFILTDYIAKAIPRIMNLVSNIKSMKYVSDGKGGSKLSSLKTIRNSLKPNLSFDKSAAEGRFYIKRDKCISFSQRKSGKTSKITTCSRTVLQE